MGETLPVQLHQWIYDATYGDSVNIDEFLGQLVKYASIYGHQSGYLHELGIPTEGGPSKFFPRTGIPRREVQL